MQHEFLHSNMFLFSGVHIETFSLMFWLCLVCCDTKCQIRAWLETKQVHRGNAMVHAHNASKMMADLSGCFMAIFMLSSAGTGKSGQVPARPCRQKLLVDLQCRNLRKWWKLILLTSSRPAGPMSRLIYKNLCRSVFVPLCLVLVSLNE